ncbi:MAG: barstar family protein [Oscillospiraceae bacterium]|nr:barstar family protein [Oscillospiraceae bacterium]
MTDVYELDGRQLSDKAEAHLYLQEMLAFPEYYGRNLDALFDVLTENSKDTLLWILHAEAVHPSITAVLEDAMEENPFLTVIFEETDAEEADDAAEN